VDKKEVLDIASKQIYEMRNRTIDILQLNKPPSLMQAKELVKITSKLSPMFGNMIECMVVERLNEIDWEGIGEWVRQDPGFPDTLFVSDAFETLPGVEIKTWYPFSTEITARFKESQSMFRKDNTLIALVSWIPEHIIYGRAIITNVWIGTASSIARSRDGHYHNPPDYLVMEPEDTSGRTSNLIQTNTNGYKFQGNDGELIKARELMNNLIIEEEYSVERAYQEKISVLRGEFKYRMDTNYAKIDRIQHEGIESFKESVLSQMYMGRTISEWKKILSGESETHDIALAEILNL